MRRFLLIGSTGQQARVGTSSGEADSLQTQTHTKALRLCTAQKCTRISHRANPKLIEFKYLPLLPVLPAHPLIGSCFGRAKGCPDSDAMTMRPWQQLLESLPSVRTLVLPAVQSLSQAGGNGGVAAASDTLLAFSASQNALLPPAGLRWQRSASEARTPARQVTAFRGFSSKSEAAVPSSSGIAASSTPSDHAAADECGRDASGEPLQVPAELSTSAWQSEVRVYFPCHVVSRASAVARPPPYA